MSRHRGGRPLPEQEVPTPSGQTEIPVPGGGVLSGPAELLDGIEFIHFPEPEPEAPTVHIVVSYHDHQTGFFAVPPDEGWKVDAASRCIVIGRGVPRVHIPLDNVQAFRVERCGPDAQ